MTVRDDGAMHRGARNDAECRRRRVEQRKTNVVKRYFLFAFVLLIASPAAFAMRCGSRIVTEGAQDFQVRDRCGEPFCG